MSPTEREWVLRHAYLRHPRTYQEMRRNDSEEKKYSRGRRYGGNLPDVRQDIPVHKQKSWKWRSKARHQWGAQHYVCPNCDGKGYYTFRDGIRKYPCRYCKSKWNTIASACSYNFN